MMIEQATVLACNDGIALVQCYAKNSCGGCSAHSACGTKALSALAGEKPAPRFTIKVNEALQVGDQIELGLPEDVLLKSVLLIYALPLLVLILTAVGFSQFFANELWVLFAMLISTGITFLSVKKWVENNNAKKHFSPIFLGKI